MSTPLMFDHTLFAERNATLLRLPLGRSVNFRSNVISTMPKMMAEVGVLGQGHKARGTKNNGQVIVSFGEECRSTVLKTTKITG